jgi:ribosomal protein S28E/S33
LVALCLLLFVGAAALAIDIGQLFVTRNELQTAADAGATAAVRHLGDAAAVRREAVDYVARNLPPGTRDDAGQPIPAAHVTVEQGVWNGSTRIFTATDTAPDAVRVIARRTGATGNPVELRFARLLGRDQADVVATAVAGRWPVDCLIALEEKRKETLLLRSYARADLVDCSAYVASDDEQPALRTASEAMVTVDPDQRICGHSHDGTGYSVTPTAGCPAPGPLDPLSDTARPTPGSCHAGNTRLTFKADATLSPGTFCGSLVVDSNVTLTLQPGVYVLRGADLKVRSNATVRVQPGGSGVLIYLVHDAAQSGESSIDVASNSTLDLWAQPTGPYAGILIYQEHHAENGGREQLFNSNAVGQLKGMVYLPDSPLAVDSNGVVAASCGRWVADSYHLRANARLSLDFGDQARCGFDPYAYVRKEGRIARLVD